MSRWASAPSVCAPYPRPPPSVRASTGDPGIAAYGVTHSLLCCMVELKQVQI